MRGRLEDAGAGADLDQLDAERPHQALLGEARPDHGGVLGVLRLEVAHAGSVRERGWTRAPGFGQRISAAGRACQRANQRKGT